jgi:F-type H+-transporting ATPase subunit epsilon
MESMNISIYSPERKLVENENTVSLLITTAEGEVEILPGHADMVATLETGRFEYCPVDKNGTKGSRVAGVISSGFINVEQGAVKVMAETLELDKEINVSRAKKAQELSEKMLSDASLDEAQFKKYQLKLQRAIIRQSIGG